MTLGTELVAGHCSIKMFFVRSLTTMNTQNSRYADFSGFFKKKIRLLKVRD